MKKTLIASVLTSITMLFLVLSIFSVNIGSASADDNTSNSQEIDQKSHVDPKNQEVKIIKPARENPDYMFTVRMFKGWNLMPYGGFLSQQRELVSASAVKSLSNTNNFGTNQYLYLNQLQNYVALGRWNSNSETSSAKEEYSSSVQNGYTHFTPAWVYLNNDVVIDVPYTAVPSDKLFANMREKKSDWKMKLGKGWNFLVVTPHFKQGKLDKGNCIFMKAFAWNSQLQRWDRIDWNEDVMNDNDLIGHSLALKTLNECSLASRSLTSPSLEELSN